MANDDAYERGCSHARAVTRAKNVWDIEYTANDNGITKAEVVAYYDYNGKFYKFSYEVDSEHHGDGERYFNAVQVDELSDSEFLRKLGVKKPILKYTFRNGCDYDRKHHSNKELKELRVFDHNNIKSETFEISSSLSITPHHGVDVKLDKADNDVKWLIVDLDKAFRERIAIKAEEIANVKHPERIQQTPARPMYPVTGHAEESYEAVWKRVDKAVRKMPTVEPDQSMVTPVLTKEQQRAAKQEERRKQYAAWKKHQGIAKEE